MPSVEGISF